MRKLSLCSVLAHIMGIDFTSHCSETAILPSAEADGERESVKGEYRNEVWFLRCSFIRLSDKLILNSTSMQEKISPLFE